MIRVLLHAPTLEIGGSERGLYEIAVRLPRDRFEASVWCHCGGPLQCRLESARIPVLISPFDTRRPLQASATIEALQRVNASVFHSFSYLQSCDDVIAAVMAGVPRVITSRSNVRHWDSEWRLRNWEKVRNRYTHAVVAVSRAAARVADEVEGIAARVIYRGIETHVPSPSSLRTALHIPADCLLLGMVGNLKPIKGHEVLLQATARVKRRGLNVRLVLCGTDYGIKNELLELCNTLGLTEDVVFLGPVDDVAPIYRALDIYVHSAHAEGLSTAVLE